MFSVPHLPRIPAVLFGRRQPFTFDTPDEQSAGLSLADDARLFATAVAGGLLFMTIYLA